MYCKNCGNELGENESFCGKCGTGVNQTESEASNKIKSLSLDKIKNIKLDNPLAKTFLITAILHLVMIVLRFVSFGEYSISVKELPVIGKSGAITLNEIWDSSIETTIFIIGMLISVFLCILPIIKGDYEKDEEWFFQK